MERDEAARRSCIRNPDPVLPVPRQRGRQEREARRPSIGGNPDFPFDNH
ncbi:hypothetical protein [Azospirillum largimobile]